MASPKIWFYLFGYLNSADFLQNTFCTAKQSASLSPANFRWSSSVNNFISIPVSYQRVRKGGTCSESRSSGLSSLDEAGLGKVPRNPLGSLAGLAYKRGWLWTSPWDIKFLNKSIWCGASGSSMTTTKLPRGKPPPNISESFGHKRKLYNMSYTVQTLSMQYRQYKI